MISAEPDQTLRVLLETGEDGATALVAPGGRRWSYAALRETVFASAERLRRLGLGPGDRIATYYPNGPEAVLLFLAAALAGTAAPLNPTYTEDEVRFYLGDTRASALVVPPGGGEAARRGRPASALLLEGSLDAEGRLQIEGRGRTRGHHGVIAVPGADDLCLILHTSGTAGRPKRVPLRQRNVVASVANSTAAYLLTPEDVSLCVMPLSHVHGLIGSALSTLGSGGTLVVPAGFEAPQFWPLVAEERVSWFTAAPSIHQTLLRRAGSRPRAARTLRFVRSSSSALAPAVQERLEAFYGAPVLQAYTMTEAAHYVASDALPPAERRPGTVGRATGDILGIVDDDWEIMPPGVEGEVVVRGPNVMNGYESEPEFNATGFYNGFFRTGDRGVLDEDGYLTIVGRIVEMIRSGGESIAPEEIDEVLLRHPAVIEAVAFGEPDETLGEVPVAAVVLREEVSDEELLEHCRAHLAPAKVPVRLYRTEEIPHSVTGKIQRRVVAAAFAGR